MELIIGQVHAWMVATALDNGPWYEQGSSLIFVRDDGEPQIVANSLTTSFALNLICPLSRQQIKGSLPVCNILGEPIFMHPPETPKAFEYMDSFQFIGWFVPVGSEPTLALKTMTCKKEVVWFPKIPDGAEEGRDRGHTLRSGRRRWSEKGTTRPIIAAEVPCQCEANGPDGSPEGQNDEKFTMEALAHLLRKQRPLSHWFDVASFFAHLRAHLLSLESLVWHTFCGTKALESLV